MTKTEEALVRIETKVDDVITNLNNHLSRHTRIENWLLSIVAALVIAVLLQGISKVW